MWTKIYIFRSDYFWLGSVGPCVYLQNNKSLDWSEG